MERRDAVIRVMGYVDQVRVNTIQSAADDMRFAFEIAEVFMALGITDADIADAMPERCGAVNPRTGMVCGVKPHSSEKHWTIASDGQRYDWYVDEPHD